ncbi:MAG: tyrosine-type recombinase/integrase [Oscillochloridaceae bacterium umkhey_bin13]
MSDERSLVPSPATLATTADLAQMAGAADRAAAQSAFVRYRTTKAAATLRAQDADLRRWVAYLAVVHERRQLSLRDDRATLDSLAAAWTHDPMTWAPVTWGLIEGFVRWQEQQGYSLASIARALATVRAYAKQAARAGAISADALTLIATVTTPAPRSKAGRNTDAQRPTTRLGPKKAIAVELTREQARHLRHDHPDTPQGRRDALLMCLLLDHGLRVSEVAALTVANLDLGRGRLNLYRPKVHLWQTLALSPATRTAAAAYGAAGDLPTQREHALLRQSRPNGELTAAGMGTRAIAARVAKLGRTLIQVSGLSPHDCRHFWASYAEGDLFTLQEAGGWSSLDMPRRYHKRQQIANQGLRAPSEREE